MDNFKAVYRILSQLEQDMDNPKCDLAKFDNEQLGVSYQRWVNYLIMMDEVGYVKGLVVKRNVVGDLLVNTDELRITLKGLEYLQENSVMQKIYKTVKGIKDLV